MGAPLGMGMHFTKRAISKGKTQITGYTIVQAEDMNSVKAMVSDHPHFVLQKATIEVLEIMPMQM